jgi:hypothetical protein
VAFENNIVTTGGIGGIHIRRKTLEWSDVAKLAKVIEM